MSFTRKIVALVTPLALLGGFSILGAQNAGAVSTSHKAQFSGNQNVQNANPAAIETKAKVKFTCNATSGIYTVKVKNFSVYAGQGGIMTGMETGQRNHVTVWVNRDPNAEFDVPLTQNTATELFDTPNGSAGVSGILSTASDCQTGAELDVFARDSVTNVFTYRDTTHLS
jgi:hypothetical protein